jgi:hypothetical protein
MKLNIIWGTFLASATAFAGGATSGGGGAYVCRDQSGAVTSSLIVDLWESQNVSFSWQDGKPSRISIIPDNNTQVQNQLDKALANLRDMEPELGAAVASQVTQLQDVINYLPQGVSLTIPNDLQTDYFPTGCPPEGMMRYNGTTGMLDVNYEIFSKLATKTDIAAAYVHEAIYKVFREGIDGAQNSVLARRLVACLFSDDCVAKSKISIPTDRDVWACTNGIVDWKVFANQSPKSWDGSTWTVLLTRIGAEKFSAYGDVILSTPQHDYTHPTLGGWLARFGYNSLDATVFAFPGNSGNSIDWIYSRLPGHNLLVNTPGTGTCSQVTHAQ